jgi:Firmicute plasmid replication protein (RepL).
LKGFFILKYSTWDENTSTSYQIENERYAIIDKETGSIVVDSPDLHAILKKAYGQKAFWKLYMADYIQVILGSMDYKQLDVFMYISLNTQPSTNLFIGTYEKIMKDCNVSKDTVYKLLKKLIEHNFIKRKQNGVYMVNPNIVMKGNNTKQNLLISYYDAEQVNTPLAKKTLEATKG